MFTGIVSSIGTIESSESRGDLRVCIACDFKNLAVGESIAVNGACLTVVDISPLPLREGVRGRGGSSKDESIDRPPTLPSPSRGEGLIFAATLSSETINCTAPRWHSGANVNLERALKMGDSVSGHLVTGHVDGLATIKEITPAGDSRIVGLEAPKELAKFIAAKGSVTLDGVSLTINRVDGAKFWVNIIPHTWAATTFHERKTGDRLNLEIDLIARYVERLMGAAA